MLNVARRTTFVVAVFGFLAVGDASQARAGLLGTSVTGSITFPSFSANFFDPANGLVPAGFLNSSPGGPTVTIAEPAIEFGYQDGANRDTANFTDTQLTVMDTVFSSATGFTMTFTDSAFTSLTLVANNFPGFSSSLVGNVITVSYTGTGSPAIFTATLNVGSSTGPSPVPEPSTVVGAGTAILMGLAYAWRRRQAKVASL